MITWDNYGRKDDVILAVDIKFWAHIGRWTLQELVYRGELNPEWRRRLIPSANGGITTESFEIEAWARERAGELNVELANALEEMDIDGAQRRSLQLKVSKYLQSRQRLRDEEDLMLSEAVRRNSHLDASGEPDVAPYLKEFKLSLQGQLQIMPYLQVAKVSNGRDHRVIFKGEDGQWYGLSGGMSQRTADLAFRARIANGFGFPAHEHWGNVKAQIRKILKPRANQLLELAGVQRMLAEALARGEKVLVCNGVVFWYEEDGELAWKVKALGHTKDSDAATTWQEGTIFSTNHGRIVVLPYIKENGDAVKGHTKNAPGDGPAKARHPEHYVNIPFRELKGDLMIGLFGELPYD